MSSLPALYRGRVQAQGDDISVTGGYSHSWAENCPITEQQGLIFIDKIEEQCTSPQIAERERAFYKARRFVRNASKQGGVCPEGQPHSFQDPKRKVYNARVDIEIASGLTFIPDVSRETQ